MARPCGCAGECGCTVLGINGIGVTGTGTSRDPFRVGLTNPITGTGCTAIMSCVSSRLGPGLRYNATTGQLSVALSSDSGNAITFGTDNGIFSTGSGTGGEGGTATVDGLVARTTPIIGGTYGAGYSMWPEGTVDPYRAAMAMELQVIHVPVRRSRENFLWAQHFRNLGTYNYRNAAETTTGYDLTQGKRQWYIPGGDPQGNVFDPDYTSQTGYFGFKWHDGRGMPRVSDVFEIVQRRAVLYLEVKDLGLSVNDTATPFQTYGPLVALIRQYGAQKSVIVGSEFPTTASAADLQQIRDGLQLMRTNGIAIAAHLTTDAMVDAVTPASLIADGYTWVMMNIFTADRRPAVVKAYKDAGLNVLLTNGARQWHYNLHKDTTRFGTGGLKGILCTDPVYCAGELNGYRYRTDVATWGWSTPDYGRHSSWSASIEGQRDRYRGYTLGGDPGNISLDGDVLLPQDTNPEGRRDSGYFILMGEQCPAPINPTTSARDNYDIEVGFIWDALVGDRGRWMSVWFGNTEDRALSEWVQASEYTRGYDFQLTQTGLFVMQRYDGVLPNGVDPPFQYSLTWDSPWRNNIQPGVEYRVKVRVRPDRIILGPASEAEGGPNTRVFNAATGGGERWRGPYSYVGRHFFFTNDSTRVRWRWYTLTAA